jgi:hypothetical protein
MFYNSAEDFITFFTFDENDTNGNGLYLYTPTDDFTSAGNRLKISDDDGATWTEISDPSWADPVNDALVEAGSDYQNIWAIVGTGVWRTTDQGTSWSQIATLSFTGAKFSLVTGPDVVVTNAASGGNRTARVTTGGTVTYSNTGHSTTGQGTAIRGVD